jgi:hypothetical protein
MPYIMKPLPNNKFRVVNSKTGEVKAYSTTKAKAEGQIKFLEMMNNKIKKSFK